MYEYRGTVTRVVDGDTYDLSVDLGFHVSVNIRVRLLGIDTPEIYHPRNEAEHKHGRQAKCFAEGKVLGLPVTIKTKKDRRGKYGRWLADIYLTNGESLADLLRDNGFEKKEVY